MKNALALYHSDQLHQKEPKSKTKLTALITDILEDQPQEALISQTGEGRVKDKAIPVVPSTTSDGKKRDSRQWTSNGSCARGAKCTFKREYQKQRKGKRRKTTANTKFVKTSTAFQNQKSATGQAQAREEETIDLLVAV